MSYEAELYANLDASTKEAAKLRARIAELEAKNARLKQVVENWKTSAVGWQKIANVDAVALSAAGYRILGPDEVDPVTVERAAEVAANWGSEIPAEIRAIGRKA